MISRRTSFIIIIVVLSLLVGGLIGFYFYTKNKNPGSTILGNRIGGRTNFGGYDPDNQTATSSTNTNTSTTTPITNDIVPVNTKVPKLRKISDVPTAGVDFVTIPIYEDTNKNVEPADLSVSKTKVPVKKPLKFIGNKTVVRYIERATGHIYETATSSLEKVRISNTTEPKIYEAYFTNRGDNLILRGLIGSSDIISTRYASLVLASTTDTESEFSKILTTKDLPIQISQVAISPSKTQLFSISPSGVRGILSKIDGGSTVGIFDTPYREWIPSWPEEKNIVLTTRASGFAPGFAYILNTPTRQITRILGNIYGLTTLTSPDLSKVLFSSSERGTFTLNYLNRKDSSISNLSFKTLPEKCIWSKKDRNVLFCAVPENIAFSTYPDVWYQGLINFSDSIWRIDINTGETRLIMNIQNESGEVIDATNLYVSAGDDYLVFTNKVDLTLWGLQLVPPVEDTTANPLDTINSINKASTTSSSTAPTTPTN
ncbi:MAG: hypothetical protein KBB54_00510 [Candidatus Pacebacteria bacterium]|nr:hypothetical protein [Candidatus Paceibacterota bacterium]MBP9818406.1 hypothetical protein [Candidatus Paceibacterota bacterium]